MTCNNPNCSNPVRKRNKYCSKSCAAIVNNSRRSKESREKQRKSLFASLGSEYYPKRKVQPRKITRASGPYSKVKYHKCTNCDNMLWENKTWCSWDCFTAIKRKKLSRRQKHNLQWNSYGFIVGRKTSKILR